MKIFGRPARPEPVEATLVANRSTLREATPLYEVAARERAFPEGDQSEQAESRPTAPEQCASVIPAGSTWRGKLKIEGSVRIEGDVTGQIQAEHTVQIAESAHVDASVRAAFVIIAGNFKGRVNSKHLELLPTARTKGDFTAVALVIGEGAIVDGRMHMEESKPKGRRQQRTPKKTQANR